MTDRIAEIRQRCEAATPGSWKVVGKDDWRMEGFPQVEMNTPDGKYFPVHNDADAAFIANAREDIPFLLAENDRLTEAQRWVPVTEKLPQPNVDALVLTDAGSIRQGYIGHATGHWCSGGLVMVPTVTHWMPLPAPPEKGE